MLVPLGLLAQPQYTTVTDTVYTTTGVPFNGNAQVSGPVMVDTNADTIGAWVQNVSVVSGAFSVPLAVNAAQTATVIKFTTFNGASWYDVCIIQYSATPVRLSTYCQVQNTAPLQTNLFTADPGANGLVVRTAFGAATAVTLTSLNPVLLPITNANGTIGNPTFNLLTTGTSLSVAVVTAPAGTQIGCGQFDAHGNLAGTGSACGSGGGGGSVNGPVTSTSGFIPAWGNTIGTLLTTGYGVQGTDANLFTAGTISGTAANLCTDANGGATTVGCAASQVYPGAGIPQSTGSAWGTSYTTLPVSVGGTGTGSTLSGILRGGSTFTASELSADAITSGSNAVTVTGINRTTLSALATGLLKNTTSTGVPSIAVLADITSLTGTGATAATAFGFGSAALISSTAAGDLSGTLPSPTVVKLNGTSLAGLSTGILKNTHTTGVPTIAADGTDYVSPTTIDNNSLPASFSTVTTPEWILSGSSSGNVSASAGPTGAGIELTMSASGFVFGLYPVNNGEIALTTGPGLSSGGTYGHFRANKVTLETPYFGSTPPNSIPVCNGTTTNGTITAVSDATRTTPSSLYVPGGTGSQEYLVACQEAAGVYQWVLISGTQPVLESNAGAYYPVTDSTTAIQWKNAAQNTTLINLDTTDGNVGILTTTPATALEVNGTITGDAGLVLMGATSGSTSLTATPTGGALLHSNNLSATGEQEQFSSGTATATSGTVIGMKINPTYNEASGSANNLDLLINRTEMAIGSGTGTQNFITAQVASTTKFLVDHNGVIENSGTKPTLTGSCSAGTQLGGTTTGSFVGTGTCTAGTYTLTFPFTANTGWFCTLIDFTTNTDTFKMTAKTTTSCTMTGTSATSDVLIFTAEPY